MLIFHLSLVWVGAEYNFQLTTHTHTLRLYSMYECVCMHDPSLFCIWLMSFQKIVCKDDWADLMKSFFLLHLPRNRMMTKNRRGACEGGNRGKQEFFLHPTRFWKQTHGRDETESRIYQTYKNGDWKSAGRKNPRAVINTYEKARVSLTYRWSREQLINYERGFSSIPRFVRSIHPFTRSAFNRRRNELMEWTHLFSSEKQGRKWKNFKNLSDC